MEQALASLSPVEWFGTSLCKRKQFFIASCGILQTGYLDHSLVAEIGSWSLDHALWPMGVFHWHLYHWDQALNVHLVTKEMCFILLLFILSVTEAPRSLSHGSGPSCAEGLYIQKTKQWSLLQEVLCNICTMADYVNSPLVTSQKLFVLSQSQILFFHIHTCLELFWHVYYITLPICIFHAKIKECYSYKGRHSKW